MTQLYFFSMQRIVAMLYKSVSIFEYPDSQHPFHDFFIGFY